MATWVRTNTTAIDVGTNADLTGNSNLTNATAPGDFDPAGVTQVLIDIDLVVTGLSDDSITTAAGEGARLEELTLNTSLGGGTYTTNAGTITTNGTHSVQVIDNAPSTTHSTAEWESAQLDEDGTANLYANYVQSGMPDGGKVSIPIGNATVTITYTPGLTYDLDSYGFYNDGTETGATLVDTTNTWVPLTADTTYHLRTLIQETGGTAAAQNFKLQYRMLAENADGGATNQQQWSTWRDVGGQASSEIVRMAASGNVVDGDATTQRIGAGSFTAGEVAETDATADSITIAANGETEVVWTIEVNSGGTSPVTWDGRGSFEFQVVTSAGASIGTTTRTPRMSEVLNLSNTFETGLSDGTVITVANSDDNGAGNAFDNLGGSPEFDTAEAHEGSLAARMPGAPAVLSWDEIAQTEQFFMRMYLYAPANPTGVARIFTIEDEAQTVLFGIEVNTNGTIKVRDGTTNPLATTAATISTGTGTYNRLELFVDTNGNYELRFFNDGAKDSTTATEIESGSNSEWAGEAFDQLDFRGSTGDGWTINFDAVAIGNVDWFGPLVLPAQASQTNFRVRTEDTVALNSTTFAAALNTNPSAIDVLGGDVTIRLRFEIDEINSLDLTDGYQLRASKNSGAYAVPASVSGVTSVNSSQYTDGDATTNVLSGSGRTFQAGEGVGSDNVTGTITALNNEHTELEFCVRLDSASLANNDTLDFRVYFDDGTALTSYTNTPRITISKVVPTRLTDWQFRSHANFTQAVNSATFGTTKNVAPTLNPSRGFRLRAALEAGSFSNTVKLQYRINTGTWTDVAVNTPGDASARTATSPVELRWYTTPSVDGTATTQLIGNGTFTAGEINDSAIATGTISLTNQETEIEWVLWFHRFSDVSSAEQISDGDTLEFRMVAGASTVIDPETANPSLTVDYPAGYIGGQVVENPTNHFAPIEDGNGNLYIFNERAESNPVWFIQKSTDQGVSWTPLDTANGPTITDYEGSDFFLANGGTEIWVLHHPGDSPRMYRFATSTHATTPDVWLDATGEQIDTAILDVIDQSIAGGLRSDGTVVAIYTGGATATHTVYANIRSSGGTWGTPFLVWTPAASEEWGHGVTGVLVGDDFYAVNNEDSVGALYGKRISSADALEDWAGTSVAASANGTLIDNAVDTGITGRQAWIGPIATGSSSLAVGGIDDTSFDGFLRHVTNLGGVGGSLTVGSRGAAINPDGDLQSGLGNSRRAQAAIAQASNGDIVVIYAKGTGQTATTSTLHYRISTDNGSTWGTETDITTVTTPARGWGSRIEMIGVRIDEDDIARVYYQDGSLAEEDDYNSSDTVGGLVTGFGWYLEIDMATGGAVTGAGTANAASDTTATTSVARVAQAIGNQASDTTGVGFVDRLGAATANAATDATGSAVVDRFAAGSADQAAEAVATAITAAFQSGAGTANAASDASASASVERSGAATANQASDAAGLSVVGRFGAASANQATDATANGTVAALEEGAGSADQAVEAIASAAVLYQAAGSADQASDVSANGTTAAGILGAGSANQATDATASAAVLRQGAASADQATDTTGVSSVERFAASSANQAEAASASSAVARFGAATADQACETAGSASATFSAVGSANQAFDAAGQFNLFVSLYANGDGTIADVVDENDLTTNIWQSIDDDPQSPTDTDWINNAATAASTFIALTDMPSSFVSASAARVQARYRGQQFGSGTVTLYAQLFQSDESTSLSDEAAVSAVTSDGAFENTAEFAITGLNTSASKAVWDAALIRFRWETT